MGTDKRARKKANRAAKSQAEQAAAARRRRNRAVVRVTVLLAISLGIFALLSWGRDRGNDTTTTTTPSATSAWEGFAALPTACGGIAPATPPSGDTFDAPDDLDLAGPITADVVTSCGTLTIALDADTAPESVNAFVFLSESGFYDRIAMHRLAPGFVVQGGDPTATGTGGAGFTVVDEFPDVGTPYPRGTVALARTPGPNASGSQFFVVLSDEGASHLGSSEALLYSVIGTVVDGWDTLDAIAALPTTGDAPAEGLFIETVTIDR